MMDPLKRQPRAHVMYKKSMMFVLTLISLMVILPVLSGCEVFDEDHHGGGRHHDNRSRSDSHSH